MHVRIRLHRATGQKPEPCWDSKSPRKCRRSSRAKERMGRAQGFRSTTATESNLPNGEGGENNGDFAKLRVFAAAVPG